LDKILSGKYKKKVKKERLLVIIHELDPKASKWDVMRDANEHVTKLRRDENTK
jgi:hypothetical protein